MTVSAIQSELMSFADTFGSAVAETWNRAASEAAAAWEEEARSAPDPEAAEAASRRASRVQRAALYGKLAVVQSSLTIAASPNPMVGLADMITMVSLQRMVLESPAMEELYGTGPQGDLVALFREQERNAWSIAERAMSERLRDELGQLIEAWRADHPEAIYVADIRLEDFARSRQETQLSDAGSDGNLLSLVMLDPLAGLDPAQRDLEKSRMLGERMFFYVSRMPQLLKWQAETLFQSFLSEPKLERALEAWETTAATAPRFAEVAEKLGEDVAAERQAALEQLFDGLTAQREALFADLEEGGEEFETTLETLRDTIAAAEELSTSLASTFGAGERLAKSVESARETGDDPAAAPSASAPVEAGAPRPEASDEDPGGLQAYREAVETTSDAAERLNVLAGNLENLLGPDDGERRPSRLVGAAQDLSGASTAVVDHAFRRALLLIGAALVAALIYRFVATRLTRSRP
jgi:hypothetical protein